MTSFTPPALSLSHWQKLGVKQHHGINIFLPGLKTKKAEMGDFAALRLLLPWVKEVGFNAIQLLPINDSGSDPSPYNIVSAHALSPNLIPANALKSIDENDPGFREFQKQNTYWLPAFALFKALKEKNEQKAFWQWPEKERSFSEELFLQFKEKALPYAYTQYIAHKEMKALKEEANHLGISLMGDLPILVSPDSVEVWQHPFLFDKRYDAGAPPDVYEQEGQHWGFPLHNFEAMAQEGFLWWKERLKTAASYYHLYRLDHTVGLFRLWAIPKGKKAKEGFYIPEKKEIWLAQGQLFLKELLAGSTLLPIAEDLGVIPPEVRQTLSQDGIPGTKVTRWERYWDQGGGFIPLKDYPPCSLTTVSTHDSETLGMWWSKENKRPLDQETRFNLLKESHQSGSLFHINLLGEYLALFNDLVYNEDSLERINIPGHLNQTNWHYRTKPYLEDIMSHPGLKDMLKKILC